MSFKDRLFAGVRSKIPKYNQGISMASAFLKDPKTLTEKPFAMQRTSENSAEIVLYGDIVSERPTDWWGDPIEGQYIILSEFLDELKQVEDVAHLTVRIHSAGGNAYDAMVIHNRLQALAADITVIVDGVAMSGGSLIMCAGDTVQVYPGSLVMIHKCWSFLFGGYNATELRRIADSDDAADRSQAAIYQVKTGLGIDELLTMMEQETYMTGQEAVDKGFADELVEGSNLEVAASADRRTLFVGAMPVWTSTRKDGIPAALKIPTVNPEATPPVVTNTKQPAQTGTQNGGKTMAKTLEELKNENPELAEQLMAEARTAATIQTAVNPTATSAEQKNPAIASVTDPVAAERQRIQDIDQMANLFDAETVNAAKYGDNACTAQEMVYRAAQKAVQQGKTFLSDMDDDANASGAQKVGAAASGGASAGDGKDLTPQQLMAQGRADAKALKKADKEEK